MKKLYSKHYQTKILNIKKLKINNKKYIGFKLNDLFLIKNSNEIIEFNYKGFSFINIKNLNNNILNII